MKSGRIPTVQVGARKLIDPAIADRAWDANTDQRKPRNSVTGNPRGNGHTAPAPPVPGTLAYETLLEARIRREQREFNLRRSSGRLVDALEVEQATRQLVRRAQKALLAIPPRLRLNDEQRRELALELRRVCELLADERVEESAAAPAQHAVASS